MGKFTRSKRPAKEIYMMQAVLFDMDGTMVNTEILWGDINRKLAQRYNVAFDERVRVSMMGKKDHESLTVFKEYFHLDTDIEELVRVRRNMIIEDVGLIQVNNGLYKLLDLLDELGLKKAVVTASFREFTNKILSTFDLEERFETIVTGDDVIRSKPDPEMLLLAANRLNVSAGNCLVLEDAQNGVEAAHNAGMPVFAIPHDASKHHDFSKATKVLSSMLEINRELITSI